jgi:hypothetical protein
MLFPVELEQHSGLLFITALSHRFTLGASDAPETVSSFFVCK